MRKLFVVLFGVVVSVFLNSPLQAGDSATAQEVVQKVNEAIAYVGKTGKSKFTEFNDQKGKWEWGGTYVFVMKCEPFPSLVTHPIKPKLIGRDLSKLKDKTGNYFFIQLCDVTKNPKGGWVEYLWPKPGEKKSSRKISYCRNIPGTPYQAGAGIYDDSISLEDLNKLSK